MGTAEAVRLRVTAHSDDESKSERVGAEGHGFRHAVPLSPHDRAYQFASPAFVLSLVISRPLVVRVGRVEASLAAAPEPKRAALVAEITVLRRRGTVAGYLAMLRLLLVLGAAGMAVAGTLP